MAPEVVPGILLIEPAGSRAAATTSPTSPSSLLAYYGIEPAPGMVGKPIH